MRLLPSSDRYGVDSRRQKIDRVAPLQEIGKSILMIPVFLTDVRPPDLGDYALTPVFEEAPLDAISFR